ncbi:hypothetical protein EKM05_06375 [Flavobacterium sp. GSP27]|uniref:Selenoprotein O n=1 Tax=Flavobacterium bomense TaxID=2497483 RepID=A0A432CML5_9FLAO|nr:hypothetical protein EKL98_07935 [Flavobacterium bomense]RTZ09918.1 hypothetical protein EKM05_06375 [Flavobacterium sp. GSP27]
MLTSDGKRWEIQTKGSGKTSFSRMGDGKAVIRSSVREYLCSETMYGLGIPASRVILWLSLYDQRLKRELSDEMKRQMEMKRVNPKYVLRNYIAQEIIEEVEKGGNEKLKKWLEILYSPFAEHPEYESYSKPTPTEKKIIVFPVHLKFLQKNKIV